MPQPNLVPVSPSVSRSTQRSGVSGVTLTVSRLPLEVKLIGGLSGVLAEDRTMWTSGRADRRGVEDGAASSFIERLTRPPPKAKSHTGRLLTTTGVAAH